MATLLEKIRTAPDEAWLLGLKRETDLYDWCEAVPNLPDEQFQRRFVGKAYGDAMQQAYEAIEKFKHGIEQIGSHISEDDHVLDFGCGWGRISQSFYRYFKPENIISADIQQEALDFSRNLASPQHLCVCQKAVLGLLLMNPLIIYLHILFFPTSQRI